MKDGHPQEPGRRLNRLRGRGKAAAGAVGSDGIVLAPPLLDQHGRLRQRVEDLPVQQLVPELSSGSVMLPVEQPGDAVVGYRVVNHDDHAKG